MYDVVNQQTRRVLTEHQTKHVSEWINIQATSTLSGSGSCSMHACMYVFVFINNSRK